MSHRPGQKTSAARASDSYHPPHSNTHLQPPSFYHPLLPLRLLLHLRPSTHPSTYSTTPFYRDVPRDGQPRLTVESALQTRSPLCIVHINGYRFYVLVNTTVLFVNHYHRARFSLLLPMPTLPPSPTLSSVLPSPPSPPPLPPLSHPTNTAAAAAAPHPLPPSRHRISILTFRKYSLASNELTKYDVDHRPVTGVVPSSVVHVFFHERTILPPSEWASPSNRGDIWKNSL